MTHPATLRLVALTYVACLIAGVVAIAVGSAVVWIGEVQCDPQGMFDCLEWALGGAALAALVGAVLLIVVGSRLGVPRRVALGVVLMLVLCVVLVVWLGWEHWQWVRLLALLSPAGMVLILAREE